MNVVIACLNSKFVHASLSPWCLLAGLRAFAEQPHTAQVMESTINGNLEAFARDILAEHPDVVAFSCYIWNITQTLELCRLIKNQSTCRLVLGGPEVAYRATDVLNDYAYVDYVLAGEGEWTFPRFLDCTDGDLSSVAGLTYRRDGAIVSNPEPLCLDTPPSPYCDEFFERLHGRIAYIETARGCPYRCAFCLSGRCAPLRFFDLPRIKRDLLRLATSGTQTVKFVDRTFNANAERANDLLLFIKEHYGNAIPPTVCFHFEIAGDILKDSTLDILASMPTGAVQLEIGMQSFNEEVLKTVNRKTDTAKLIRNIRKLMSFGNMHIHIDLIAGLTGEDFAGFRSGFHTAYSLGAHMLQLGFLKLLHGADMREQPDRYPCTFSQEPPYEVTSTPCLSAQEIAVLKRCEDALDRLYNSGRFLCSLAYLTEEVGIAPFDLFCEFGGAVSGERMSLSDYAAAFYEFFASRCDGERLRDAVLCDLLCSSPSAPIPLSLDTRDAVYKRAKKYFVTQLHGAVKVAHLPATERIVVVDPTTAKTIRNRYDAVYYDLADLEPKL